MTPEQKQAWDMQQSGMTRQQIADSLGISVSSVKSRLERARKWMAADPAAQVAAEVAGSNVPPHSFWLKTDTHSIYYKTPQDDDKADILEDIAEAFKDIPAYRPNPVAPLDNDLLTVYPLYDMHIGMLAWGRETRDVDYDLDLMKSDLINAIDTVSKGSPKSDDALIILGGDTLHINDHFNETPASGHKMDADGRFEKIVDVAIESITNAIELVSEIHARVSVIVLRGNHDETSHIVLKAALKQRYRLSDNVSFPSISGWDKSEIYWFKHGKSLIVAHHGDKATPERLAMIAADKCPHWTDCKYRVILTGHKHTFKVIDMPGCTHFSLRAFCPPDAYGAMFGGVRGMVAMTFAKLRGLKNMAFDPIERG